MKLLAELRRRNVIRMAGLYLVGAWLITQVAATVLPLFDAPAWMARRIIIDRRGAMVTQPEVKARRPKLRA